MANTAASTAFDAQVLAQFQREISNQQDQLILVKTVDQLHDVNFAGPISGRTALHHASIWNKVFVCKFLLKNGADALQEDDDELTALHLAARAGSLAVVELFLSQHVYPTPVLSDALARVGGCSTEHIVQICRLLLSAGADPSHSAFSGRQLAHCAAREGNIAVLQVLLEYRSSACLNERDLYGLTALHHACFTNQLETIQFLLCHGADATAEGVDGFLALHVAARSGCAQSVAMQLAAHPSLVNVQENNGNTPLHHAMLVGSADVAMVLITYGCDTTLRNLSGLTPLQVCKTTPVAVQQLINQNIAHVAQQQQQQQPRRTTRRCSVNQPSGPCVTGRLLSTPSLVFAD